MRTILVLALLANTLYAQPPVPDGFEPAMPFDAHQIEQAAVKSFADLERKVATLEAENESLRQQIRELTKGKEPTPALDKAARNLAKLALNDVAGVHKASYAEIEKAVGELVEANSKIHLTVVTADNCPACPEAKRLVKPWALKAGYEYDEDNHKTMRGGTYPRYRLCWGGNCEEFTSKIPSLGDAIASRLKKWGAKFHMLDTAPAKRAEYRAPHKVWGMHEGHVTPSVIGMTIEYHLTHEPHFIDITGMTVAEMEAKHQELHR